MATIRQDRISAESAHAVRLRIPTVKLLQLFASGNMHVEDFQCLDARSKSVVRHLLLSACLERENG